MSALFNLRTDAAAPVRQFAKSAEIFRQDLGNVHHDSLWDVHSVKTER